MRGDRFLPLRLPCRLALSRCILALVAEQLDLTVYESGEDGWVLASIPEVAGVFSQSFSREEARANVIDTLRLMLSPEPSEANDQREREALHFDDRCMKRRDLEGHLRAHGCRQVDGGGNHARWAGPQGERSVVPTRFDRDWRELWREH
jgi:predicted RNase H-like HicB family nuclease